MSTKELYSLWGVAEERMLRLNGLNINLSFAILDDLRLAGYYHLQSTQFPEKECHYLDQAILAAQRAIYRAVEAELLYHLQCLRMFNSDFSSVSINIPNFNPIEIHRAQREAEKVEQLILQINQNNLSIEKYFHQLLEYCAVLEKTASYLVDVRPEAEKQKLASRTKLFSGAVGGIVGFLGFIITLLSFIIGLNYCDLKKEIVPFENIQDAGQIK